MTGVVGVDDCEARETQEAFVDALFSFGGGIGGECFEEAAANLKTLREAKREDDEVDCFCPDPELLVVAIEGMEGEAGCADRGSAAGGCCTGRSLSLLTDFGPEFARIRTSLDLALFGNCGAASNRSHGRQTGTESREEAGEI